MKIRLDYVSNSSSSSFMIVGTAKETEEVKELFKNSSFFEQYKQDHDNSDFDADEEEYKGSEYSEEDEYEKEDREWEELDDAFWNYIDDWLEEYGLSYYQGLEEYGEESVCIGMKYDDMKNDETKAQFEQRISDALEKLFGEPQMVECMIDGGRVC